jgi:hypothetical protein
VREQSKNQGKAILTRPTSLEMLHNPFSSQ